MDRTGATNKGASKVPGGADLVEWSFEQGWTDGLPVVPPTRDKVAALGGAPEHVERKIPPRHGSLTREVLAINLVLAGLVSRLSG